jgi:hypothetical protein
MNKVWTAVQRISILDQQFNILNTTQIIKKFFAFNKTSGFMFKSGYHILNLFLIISYAQYTGRYMSCGILHHVDW